MTAKRLNHSNDDAASPYSGCQRRSFCEGRYEHSGFSAGDGDHHQRLILPKGDITNLKAEDVDWMSNTVSFTRKKSGDPVMVYLGQEALNLRKDLPAEGPQFPYVSIGRRMRGRRSLANVAPSGGGWSSSSPLQLVLSC